MIDRELAEEAIKYSKETKHVPIIVINKGQKGKLFKWDVSYRTYSSTPLPWDSKTIRIEVHPPIFRWPLDWTGGILYITAQREHIHCVGDGTDRVCYVVKGEDLVIVPGNLSSNSFYLQSKKMYTK